jgi:hypothetical protein
MARTSRRWALADVLVTMADEIAEAVEILRPHYPEDGEADLRQRAAALRAQRYQSGRWPSSSTIATIVRLSYDEISPAQVEPEPLKRKRGRPKGSKNKPKVVLPDVSLSYDAKPTPPRN